MNTDTIWETVSTSSEDTEKLGRLVAANLRGGEVIELISDLGGGKTTFVHGLAEGLGYEGDTSSPTFNLANTYTIQRNSKGIHLLYHLDFYRLSDPGVTALELEDYLGDGDAVVVVEWAAVVNDVLPLERLKVKFDYVSEQEHSRKIVFSVPPKLAYLLDGIKM